MVIAAHQVADNLSNKKEFILKKRAWELMNPEYQKVFALNLFSKELHVVPYMLSLTFLLMIIRGIIGKSPLG